MSSSLAGKHILIVEDEYFIASDLKRALDAETAIVVGPVGNVAAALELASTATVDAAVLDVNLQGALSYPIAAQLAERGIPFMFVTGYDGWALPEEYGDVIRVAKPFPMQAVVRAVDQLCTRETGR